MFSRFLNTRAPSFISMLAFAGCCLIFCVELMSARDTAEVTPTLLLALFVWGGLALAWMLVFCLCLARVTRYRRSLPD